MCSSIGQCSICLSTLYSSDAYVITKCGHVFHGQCIKKWIKNAFNCPTCRTMAFEHNILKLFIHDELNVSNEEEITVTTQENDDNLTQANVMLESIDNRSQAINDSLTKIELLLSRL